MLRRRLDPCQTVIFSLEVAPVTSYPLPHGETMADLPRLNGVIRALEQGKHAFTSFTQADPESAIAMTAATYDGVIFEMEHNPYDIRALRDSLQYMLNRRQIAQSGSLAPAVTPMV